MKNIRRVFIVVIMFFLTTIFVGCKNPTPPTEVNVSFAKLKEVVDKQEDIDSWQGLSVTTISAGRGNSTYKSNKTKENNVDKVDFIYEKGNDKVYCDDNVRYHVENNRKYIDESEFDEDDFVDYILDNRLESLEDFFEDSSNLNDLIKSNKEVSDTQTIYTFEICLNKDKNTILKATYTIDENNKLISIKITITSNDENQNVEDEIKENTEIVTTPQWFDSNDYKSPMTYGEVKAIVMNTELMKDWSSAYILVDTLELGGDWDETSTEYYISKDTTSSESVSQMIKYKDNTKSYAVDNKEYIYVDDEPSAYIDHTSEGTEDNVSFDGLLSARFQLIKEMFIVEDENYQYYTNSKKYEKDKTIVSFRFMNPANGDDVPQDEIGIGSLYFNTAGELYLVDFYMVAGVTNFQEKHLTYKKLDQPITSPEWFNEAEFEDLANQVKIGFNDIKDVVTDNTSMNSWSGMTINTLSASRGNSKFKSGRSTNGSLSFVYDKGNEKRFYHNGVQYFIENDRKYLDENYFNYDSFKRGLLDSHLGVIESFFKNNSNISNLIKSDIEENDLERIYTFEILLDKSSNTILTAKYKFDIESNRLISINISIKSNDQSQNLEDEIKENTEIVNTPEWFDSNDYKTTMTYEEVKAVVLDEHLLDDWQYIKIFNPLEMLSIDYEYYGNNTYNIVKTNDMSYSICENIDYKIFLEDNKEYFYKNGSPYDMIDYTVNDSQKSVQSIIDENLQFLRMFFIDEVDNFQYYTTSKKYEKEQTIISYRYICDDYDIRQSVIGSLYYDLNNNLYKIDIMMEAYASNYQKVHCVFTKESQGVDIPAWLNREDFLPLVHINEVKEVVAKANVLNLEGFDYVAEIAVKDNTYLSDGVHFRQTAQVDNVRINDDYYRNSVYELDISDEAQSMFITDEERDEYSFYVRENAYKFWLQQSKLSETKLYSYDRQQYMYSDGVAQPKVTVDDTESGFAPTFVNVDIYQILNSFYYQGQLIDFAIPGNYYIQANQAMVYPGQKIGYYKCTKEETSGGTQYVIYYKTYGPEGADPFFTYTINLDRNGNFVCSEIRSNFLVQIENAITTITFTNRTDPIVAPEWFNPSDFE